MDVTCMNVISILSNVCTILATVTAIYAFYSWRKQQLYSKIVEHLLDMEDYFEILVITHLECHAHIVRQFGLACSAEGRDKEYKKSIDDQIRQSFIEASWREKLSLASFNYQLAFFRAKRMGLPVDQVDCFNPQSIGEVFSKPLENLEVINSKSVTEEFAEEVANLKKDAFENFERLRKSF